MAQRLCLQVAHTAGSQRAVLLRAAPTALATRHSTEPAVSSTMTSVKPSNDTALKSTHSHAVIGEGLIPPLPSLTEWIKYSVRPEGRSAKDPVRPAPQ